MIDLNLKKLLVMCAAVALATPALAQQQDDPWWEDDGWTEPGDMEWEPDQGYHEEEWYDPSDWFDADRTPDYERDWYEQPWNDRGVRGPRTARPDYMQAPYGGPYTGYRDDMGYNVRFDTARQEDLFEDDFFAPDYDTEYEYYTDDWYNNTTRFDRWYDRN